MFESKFVKFLISIFKWRGNSSPNFASFFIVTRNNSSVNFKPIYFLLWTNGSHQSPNFDTLKCSGESLPNSSCHFSKHKSVFLQILRHSSVSWKMTSLYCFSSNIIYFGHEEPIKTQFLWTYECSGQIRQIPHVSFKKTSQFIFNFCIILHCHSSWNITPL